MQQDTQQGFTLIELMVTIAVLAIVLNLAMPMVKTSSINRQADRIYHELQIDLMFARNQALALNKAVTIKPTSGGWIEGRTIEQDGVVIRQRGGASNPIGSATDLEATYTATAPLVFDRQGRVRNDLNHATSGYFSIRVIGCKGNRYRTLYLNFMGQITVKEEACI